jgi:glyoxylase-like metal-dependent hydrolase (beta-lactamase superfamily II)
VTHSHVDLRLETVVPDVWRVGGGSWNGHVPTLSSESDCNIYLVRSAGADVLVDCGTLAGFHSVKRGLGELGASPTDLIVTHSHWDHTEAAAQWQQEWPSLLTHLNSTGVAFLNRGDHRLVGYEINEPPHDFDVFRVDHRVSDRESFRIGARSFTAHHLPGHTPDSTLYTVELGDMTIGICGDIVFAPRPGLGPVLGQLCTLWLSNLDEYVDSLRRMAALQVDVLLPGHGAAIVGRPQVSAAVESTLELADALAKDGRLRENVGV